MSLDLSARGTAALALPCSWAGDWTKLRCLFATEASLSRGAAESERAIRLNTIAQKVVRFALDYEVTLAYVEDYAFSRNNYDLGELRGVVRHELIRAGVPFLRCNMGTARKLMLGKIPRGKGAAKAAVFRSLKEAGMPLFGPKDLWFDQSDAFAVMNFGLSELGGYCFAQL